MNTARSALILGLLIVGASRASEAQSASALARDFNTAIGPINDQIDTLRGRLNDSNLSMRQASQLVDQQSALRAQADTLWSTTQADINGSYSQLRKQIVNYNSENRRLEFQSSIVGSQVDVLNNVAKNKTRAIFDQNKEKMARDWEAQYGSRLKPFGDDFAAEKASLFAQVKDTYGIDMARSGYSRIGTINPYTGETYYKYYGPDGNLVAGQWKDDTNGWDKWRGDVEASRRRQQDVGEGLRSQAGDLGDFSNQFDRTKSAVGSRMTTLGNMARKVDFGGNWNGRDNVGNWVKLALYNDGTMLYSYGKTSTIYRANGFWSQSGQRIKMGTNDGKWSFRSAITEQYYLEFTETSSGGQRYTDYLKR